MPIAVELTGVSKRFRLHRRSTTLKSAVVLGANVPTLSLITNAAIGQTAISNTVTLTVTNNDLSTDTSHITITVTGTGAGPLTPNVNFRMAVTQANQSFPPAWRVMGLVYEKLGEKASAHSAFQRYLQLAPGASDAPIIRQHLESL